MDHHPIFRSSIPELFLGKDVLKKFSEYFFLRTPLDNASVYFWSAYKIFWVNFKIIQSVFPVNHFSFLDNSCYLKNCFKATPSWNWQKIKQMLSSTFRLNFFYLKIIHILYPRYHPKIQQHILKNNQKNMYTCTHDIILLIIIKTKMKMKNKSHIHGINISRSRHGPKYSKYKKFLSIMMLLCIKQHLCNIWRLSCEKVKQYWRWVLKKCCV